VRLVEHLRNVEGVSELSVHALSEVPLAFKAFYRVEVPGAEAPAQPVAEVPAVEVPSQEMPPPLPVVDEVPSVEPVAEVVEEAVPALAAAGEDAPSSLGFFA
jgi:hypothetical protein